MIIHEFSPPLYFLPLIPKKEEIKLSLAKSKSSISRFDDVTIYRRVENNMFVSLTEMELRDFGPKSICIFYEINEIDLKYDFCISVFTCNKISYVAGLELDDIIALAGIKNKSFIRQMQTGVDLEDGENITAQLCAKKIVSYPYGKCVQELRDSSGKVFIDFYRTTFEDSKRNYPIVFSKAFKNIPIKVREVNVWTILRDAQQPKNDFRIVR